MLADKFLSDDVSTRIQKVFKDYNIQFTLKHSGQINLEVASVNLTWQSNKE
jgi:hypothetical protein